MPKIPTYSIFIDGEWRAARSGEVFESENPYTGKPWCTIPRCSGEDADDAVQAAACAFRGPAWRGMHASDRGRLLIRLAQLIGENAEDLAQVEVRDNGKLMAEMVAQCRYIPRWFEYFGGLADKIEGRTIPSDKPDMFVYTRREPLGVVVAIVPWNSPLLLSSWHGWSKLLASRQACSTSLPALVTRSAKRSRPIRMWPRWRLPAEPPEDGPAIEPPPTVSSM